MMTSIRGGMGLGDALYVQAVARHLVGRERVEVCTKWPDVFRPLAGVTLSPFRRDRISRLAHYSLRRAVRETDQFEDCCLQAGLTIDVPLRLDWRVVNGDLIARVKGKAAGRPIVLLQLPRAPMDRKDGYGDELVPDLGVIQAVIDRLRGQGAFVVQAGAGVPLHRFTGVDLDLANATSVCELLDLASAADAFLGSVSFIVPLAESLERPVLVVWSRRGLQSKNEIIRWLTPAKVLHGPRSRAVMDDAPGVEIVAAADALCEPIRRPVAV